VFPEEVVTLGRVLDSYGAVRALGAGLASGIAPADEVYSILGSRLNQYSGR
jgi:hypothetical protein